MKSSGNPPPSLLKFCLLMLMLVSYTDTFVIGAPKGGQVISGTASFTQNGNLTVITAGNRSIINYTGFDIGKNETVQFIQPGAHATVLNRVTTPDPTNIFGQLQSNGIVIISNPYGVFFQNGSVVNVGGLLAGAGKVSDADFTAGKIHFTDLTGDVRNDGVIAADNRIALLGANVANAGSMTAAHGVAMMVSGPDVYVGDKNGNVFVQANGKALKAAAAVSGATAASTGGVTNSGTVAAPRVVLGAGDMYSTAIVNSGLLQGRSIALNAGKNGSAMVGGTLDASSAHHPTATGKGGNIDVLGGKVALQGATLDATGQSGGGNVRVGGDFHGASTLAASTTTTVDAATAIKADATGTTGNGGTVAIWSEKGTNFLGQITARAGSASGDGGQVEISSHAGLGYDGKVDAGAANGKPGSLLLDPTNIEISSTSGNTPPSQTINPGDTPTGTDANGTYVIAASAIENGNPSTALTLQASQDFRIDSLTGQIGLTNLFGVKTVGQLTFPAPVDSLALPLAPVITPITLVAGGAGTGSFVMANPADTLATNGRPITITANGLTAAGGINTGVTNAIQLGKVNASPGGTATAGGTVTLLDTLPIPATNPPAVPPGFPVQVGDITTTSATGAGGAVNITFLPPTTVGAVTTQYYAPTSITTGLLNTATTTANGGAGGNITLTALGGVTVGGAVTTGTASASAAGYLLIQPLAGVVQLQSTVNTGTTTATGGPGGDVVIGSIFVPASISLTGPVTTGAGGTGSSGMVYLASSGPLTLGNTVSTAAANGTGGKVTLTIDNTNTTTAVALALPGISTGGALGGGDIVVANNNPVTGSNLTVSGALTTSETGNGATSGKVQLTAPAITLNGSISTRAAGAAASASNGGDVTLSAPTMALTNPNTINTTGTATGTSGAVSLDGTGTLSTDTTTTIGLGGAISAGSLTTGAGTTTFNDGGAVTTNGGGQTYGGPVVLNQTAAGKLTTVADTGVGNISFDSTVASAAANPGQSLTVTGAGTVALTGGVDLSSATGAGGALTVGATGAAPTGITVGPTTNGAADGAINTAATGAAAGNTGNGGAVTLKSSGAIVVHGAVNAGSAGAAGGSIGLTSTVGNVSVGNLSSASTATTAAAGGAVALDTAGTLSVGTVDSSSAAGAGGAIILGPPTLNAASVFPGSITAGALTSSGVTSGGGVGLFTDGTTTGNISIGAVNTSASAGVGGSFLALGKGAFSGVGITATSAGATPATITIGDSVTVTPAFANPFFTPSSITLTGALATTNTGAGAAAGNGGAIRLFSPGAVSFTSANTASSAASGGAVTIGGAVSNGVQVLPTGITIDTLPAGNGTVTTTGAVNGGAFSVDAKGSVAVTGAVTTSTSGAGAGGQVLVLTDGNNATATDSFGAISTTSATGAGGNVDIGTDGATAHVARSVTTGAITTGLGGAGGTSGAGGNVQLLASGAASPVSVQGISTSSAGSGNAGSITIGNAANKPSSITLNGGNLAATGNTGAGGPVSLLTSGAVSGGGAVDSSSAGASGGAISVVSTGGAVTVGALTSSGQGAGNGGNVTVTTGGGGALSVGDIDASATTSGTGGTVALTSAGPLGAGAINASTNGSGAGGNVSLLTDATGAATLTPVTTLGINASSVTGAGGSITVAHDPANDLTPPRYLPPTSITINGPLNTTGGTSNGPIVLESTGNVTLASAVNTGRFSFTGDTSITGNTLVITYNGTAATAPTFDLQNHSLTLAITQGVTVDGSIGGTTGRFDNVNNFTIAAGAGLTTFDGDFTTEGNQTYNGNGETLTADTTLHAGASTATGSIAFNAAGTSGFNDNADFAHNLTLVTGTDPASTGVTIDQPFGATHPFLSLTATTRGTTGQTTTVPEPVTINARTVAAATQSYGTLTLTGTGATTLTSAPATGGSISSGAVSATGQAFNVNATGAGGATTFAGLGSAAHPLGATDFEVAGLATFNGSVNAASFALGKTTVGTEGLFTAGNATVPTVQTSAGQTYGEPVFLGAATTLTDTGSKDIALALVRSDTAATAEPLTVNTAGITTLGGTVGAGGFALASVTTDAPGTTRLNAASIETTGAQTYNDTVTLGATTTLTSDGNGDIKFASTLDSNSAATPRGLTVNTGGTTIFGGLVGATTAALASVTTDAPGTTQITGGVTTTGAQTYGDPVSLEGDSLLKGTTLSFPSFTGNNFNLTLTFTSTVTANGFSGIHDFLSNGGGGTILAGNFSTTGYQDYENAVTLSADTTLTSSGGGAVTLAFTVGGPFALSIGTTGTVTFGGAVGTTNTPLTSVATTGGGEVDLNGGSIITNGVAGQSFAGPVVLGVAGATPTTTLTAGGVNAPVFFGNTIQGRTGTSQALEVAATGKVTLTGAVGTLATPLAGFRSTGAGEVDIDGSSVFTNGAPGQFYQGNVVLGSTLATPATTLAAGVGPMTFMGKIDGLTGTSQALTLTTTGATTFSLGIGTGTALASLATAAGPLLANGGAIDTTGAQTYNGAVTLGATGAVFTSAGVGANGAILFNFAVDGGEALTVNTAGATTFTGAVGGGTPLTSLTTDAAGTTIIGGGVVKTTGAQLYNDAVTLASTAPAPAATTLTAGAGGIDFVKTLDGNAAGTQALVLVTPGTQTFGGTVGAGFALASLTTGVGPVALDGGAVTTTGAQTYNGALTLGNADATLTSTGPDPVNSAITFNSTLQGAFTLTTATSGGNTVFGALSGSVAGSLLTGLTTSASGATFFNNAALSTNGTQTYQGPVVVQSAARALSLIATTGNIVFDQTLDSTKANSTDLSLTTDAVGSSVTFTGAVGGGITAPSDTAFNSLTVTSPTIHIDGGVVNTASSNPRGLVGVDGTQTYNGAVDLGKSTTFVGTSITNTGVIDAQGNDLTLTLSGVATVPLAGIVHVHNFTSNGTGGTDITGSFLTTGYQHYANAVTLSGDSTLTAGIIAGQDSIFFGSTVQSTGHFALTLDTAGPVTFSGAVGGNDPVGGVNALGSLVTLGAGAISLDGGSVITLGNQTYAGAVTLGPTAHQTTLTSTTGGTIRFKATVDGDAPAVQALTTSTSGAVEFDAAVGGTNPLQSLTANGTGATNIDGGSVTTTGGGQNYQGPVVVNTAATTTLSDTTTGNLTFGSTLDNLLAGTPTLNLQTGGSITFTGQVGHSGALGTLNAGAGGTIFVNGGLVRSTGSQTYDNPNSTLAIPLLTAISLGNTATFTSTNGGNLTFDSTVDGATSGAQGLTVNTTGNGVFAGIVGGIALASLTTDAGGQTQFNMPIGTTAAAGVHVTGDVTIGDTVLFGSTGGSFAQPSVLSGGSQSYSGGTATQNVFLVGGGTFGSTGTLDFGNTHDLSLRFGGLATVPGGLTGVQNFLTDGAGGTLINGTFATTGTQTYSDNVSLAGTPILTSVGNLTFNDPVNGNAPLTLNGTGTGAQVLFTAGALVGNITPIGALTTNSDGGTVFGMNAGSASVGNGKGGVNAASVTAASGSVLFNVAGATSAHPSILTTGLQAYQGAGTLSQDTVLKSSGDSTISFTQAGTLDSALTTSHSLTLITGGTQTFTGLIGSMTPLSGLTTGTGPTIFNMNVGAAQAGVRLNGPLLTGGATTFDEVGSSLTQPSVLTLLNGAQTYGGTVTLSGPITVLNSANTEPATGTFHGGGTITFDGNIVSSIPVNAMNGTPELDVRAGAGTVEFDAPVSTTGDFAPGGASVVFKGSVGPVGTFTVLPNDLNTGIGGIDINGGSVTTGGAQVFNFPTVLSANTTLTAGGNVTFVSTLDGSNLLTNTPYTLDIKISGGAIAFNGIVGGIVPLESLTTENVGATVGTTQFNMTLPLAGSGKGGVNVIDAVKIGTNVDFEAVGLAGGTVPTILSGVTYLGQVGTGTQTYGGTVTLGLSGTLHQTTVLRDIAAGDITFNGRVNGKADGDAGLSVNSNGDEVFNQLVGDAHPLASLSTDDVSGGAGTTRFNMDLTQVGAAAGVRVAGAVNVNDRVAFNATGGLVRPTILSGGAQSYALAATVRQGTALTIDPTLRAAGLPADSGNVTFQSTVDSGATARDLQVNSPGNEVFKGLVGYGSPLASLTTDATGPATGQTRFLMTLPPALPGAPASGGINVNGNVLVNDGVFFQVGNTSNASPFQSSVSSGGSQTYVGAATLAAQTILVSGGGSVAFNSTVDSDTLATPQNLTISTPVNTFVTFAQALGGTFPLASLNVTGAGKTQLDGGLVSTTLGQQYGQAVTLGQDTTLLSTDPGGSVSFAGSLDGNHNLTVTAPGANFVAVGNALPLLNLTIIAPSGAKFAYDPTLVTAGNAGVNLAGTLQINGPAFFAAPGAGGIAAVRTGVAVAGFTGTSAQIYSGAFTLQGTETFTDLKSGDITFRQTVDGTGASGLNDLTVSTGGTIAFNGTIGAATPLTSLTTSNLGLASGLTVLNGGSVTTVDNGLAGATGAQAYNDAVVLGANTVLVSATSGGATTGGDIAFGSTLDSNGAATPQALTVNTSGRTVFGGAVGAVNALASLTTDNEGAPDQGTFLNGGSVTTTGAQTYNDAATLGAGTTLTSNAGGGIVFASTLDSNGAATPQALTVNTSGRTVFGGAVGATAALASLTTDNEGAPDQGTFLNGGSVTTTGAQTYNDAVAIGAATMLTSTTGGDIAFGSTLDSNGAATPQALTVNTSGRTVFGGAVGAVNALASLTTDNEGAPDQGTFLNGGSVTTTGAQTYNDAVAIGANTVLASRANGTLVFNNTVNGAFTLTLNTGGLTIFNRAVGGVTPLAGLTTDNAGAVGEGTQFNMTVGSNAAGVVVNGPVTINDAVGFDVQGSSLTRPGILTIGNDFNQTYNGPATLVTSTFLVSAAAPATGGAFTGGGSIIFNSPQGIVAKGGNDLTVRAGVGTDALTAAVNVGALDLGGASATFHGPITLPGTLSVEPNDATGGGSIALSGSTLTTTGAQFYNASVVLGANTVATSTGGGTITFNSTVNGPFALTLNTASNEVFNARVGGLTPLASLTTDDPAANTAGGHVIFNVAGSTTAATGVTTTGAQTYHDAATLRADTVLASTGGGTLTFGSTVDSDNAATPRSLTLNSAGDQVFDGQVGGGALLASLTTDDPAANATGGRTIFNVASGTPSVTTAGFQTYHDAVVLQAGTTLTSTGGGALTFVSTVDGPASLTVDTAGQTTFRGAVGGGSTLAGLTTQGGGGVAINGRTVTTTGLQTYGGVVTFGADTVLTSTATAGGITFATTLDSDATTTPRALTLNAAGDEIFNGRIGSNAPLASLTTDDPAAGVTGGRVIFNVGGGTPDAPSVVTTGFQTYHDAALLQTGTVLASTGGGTITFNSTVDGPFALTLDTAGNEVFGGTVGGTQPLASLTTDAATAGGQVVFGLPGVSAATLGVTTTGLQTYHDAALLQTGATLTSTQGGTLTFASTVDGPFALTLNSKGDEIFDGQIGHKTALASLGTDVDAKNVGGNVRFFFVGTNGSPSVTTTGAQAYHDPAVLQADTVLASTGGGRLAFLSTVDNSNVSDPHALTLNSSGDELFGGLIGAAKAIGSLTTDAAGATGGQTQFALDLTGQTGNVAGVRVAGAVTVNDAVSFDAPGVSASHVLVQSTGAQVYQGPATVAADAVLASSGGGAVTFNSTVVGPRGLSVNTDGTMTFNGAVGSGAGNALAGLSAQGGPVVLNAGAVTTTGAQNYSGPVTLAQDTSLTSSADGITFGSTLDGTHVLTLATAGATSFNGAVGGTDPLTNLTATDGSGVIVNGGRVATLGLQTYGGEVTVNGPATGTTLTASNDETSPDVTQHGNLDFRQNVTVNSGSLLVQGRRILAEENASISVAGSGDLNLQASDVLILRGASYGSDSGHVLLNDPQNDVVPTAVNHATVFLTNQRTTFHGGSFDLGYLQNMYSQGSIFINVGNGPATLSDIAANGVLNVTAGSITLRARNADPTRGGSGGGTDDGLNFVARTSISFGNAPIRYDNTNSTNDVANFVTTSGQATVNRDRAVGLSLFENPTLATDFARLNGGLNFSDANFASFSGFPLQPISGGTQTIDTAAALSGALPDQKPLDVAVDITVTAGQLEELKKLGIHPRRAAKQERLSLNAKRALFAQLVDGQDQENYGLLQPIKGGVSRLVPSDYVVVVDRMSEREVQSILTAFEQLYGKNKEKAAPIGESFNAAFTDYTTEKQTGDPAGFAPYLVAKPGKYPDVDKAVRGFDNLFGYIESLGLTNKEQAKSKEHIASDLQVAGVSPEDMVKVIDTLRTKIPKDQKASSTKLPPSPPAAAPAPGATNPPPPAQKATPPLKTARQPGKDPARKTVREAKPVKEERLHEVAGL